MKRVFSLESLISVTLAAGRTAGLTARVPGWQRKEKRAFTAGTRLGRQEIRSLVGAGGMGEVYRARDPKIGRDVAIKVLPAGVSADRERVARFEQEAQAAGALIHPNILAIYDVDTQDGVLFVVSELLEGEE